MTHWCYEFSKLVLWLFFRVGFHLEVSGQEHVPKRGAFIAASNHVSFLDPPVVGVACPRRLGFMARASLYRHPVLGAYLRSIGAIPIRRGEADLAAIRTALARLRNGDPIAIFPEGHRQESGRLSVAKRGVGFVAETARVPVLPVFVNGTFEALPPRARCLSLSKIRVAFGTPIAYTEGPSRLHHERIAEAVTQQWRYLERQLTS